MNIAQPFLNTITLRTSKDLKRAYLTVMFFLNSMCFSKKNIVPSVCNNIFIYDELLKRLLDARFIYRMRAMGGEDYLLNKAYFSFKAQGLLENILYGMSYAVERYLSAIPAVNVIEKSTQDQQCGTGILVGINVKDGESHHIIVTNQHVVDPARYEISSVVSKTQTFDVISNVYEPTNTALDLAAFEVRTDYSGPKLVLLEDPRVLDTVVTIGFPRVPMTVGQSAMSHKGEVNGFKDTMTQNKYIVISCQVSPGNSGGPVLGESGACVGIVTQSLFEKDREHTPYHCAIPATDIQKFIQEYCVKHYTN